MITTNTQPAGRHPLAQQTSATIPHPALRFPQSAPPSTIPHSTVRSPHRPAPFRIPHSAVRIPHRPSPFRIPHSAFGRVAAPPAPMLYYRVSGNGP